MTMNEKAAAGVVSADDSRRDQASQQDLPRKEYIMRGAVVQVVEPFLLHGAENAISTKELQRWTGLGVRDLRAQVAREREAGALILSRGEGGYFLPDDGEKGRDELRRFVVLMQSEAINTYRATLTAQEELKRQIMEELEDGET